MSTPASRGFEFSLVPPPPYFSLMFKAAFFLVNYYILVNLASPFPHVYVFIMGVKQ